MKYLVILAIIVVSTLVIYGCKVIAKDSSSSTINKENNTSSVVMGLSKSSCKGTCEVFDLTIDKNQTATYIGIKHVENIGTFTASLSKAQFQEIEMMLKSTDFKTHKPDYTGPIADLQSFTIEYDNYTVKFQRKGGPKDLFPIIEAFDILIKELDWKSK